MKDSRGFTLVAGLLVVLIIGVFGFAGYYVYNEQSKKNEVTGNDLQLATSGSLSNTKIDEEGKTDKLVNNKSKINLAGWKVSNEKLGELFKDENETARYQQTEGDATLVVYSDSPIIYYSSNAPVYCKYDGKSWVNYSALENLKTYKVDNSSKRCNSIDQEKLGDYTVFADFGGALGFSTYSAVVEGDSEWYVFTVSETVTENADQSSTEKTEENLRDEMKVTLNDSLESSN